MPKISVGTYVQGSGSGAGSSMDEIRNPLSGQLEILMLP